MKNVLYGILTACFCIFGSVSVLADVTIKADGTGDWPTIQEGINHVSPGETVWLEGGTYSGIGNQDLDFQGKEITVSSVSGGGGVTIDCGGTGRGFIFQNGETRNAQIINIWIENGSSVNGAAILIEGASPTVRNCNLENCIATGSGGAIYVGASSNPLMDRCTVRSNSAVTGAGIDLAEGSADIINCFFNQNSATDGGAIHCSGTMPLNIYNCTILSNSAANYGGGLHAAGQSVAPVVVNTIFRSNTAASGGQIALSDAGNPSSINLDYCDIQGGFALIYQDTGCVVNYGLGNIDLDPQFYGPWTFMFQSTSPCIDSGTSDTVTYPLIPGTDYLNTIRPVGNGMDIGCYESTENLHLQCGFALDNEPLLTGTDNFSSGMCGYAGIDRSYLMDDLIIPAVVTVALTDEQGSDFMISLYEILDTGGINCLATATDSAHVTLTGDNRLYAVVDGGPGTFDISCQCCAPDGAIVIGTTSYCTIQDAMDVAVTGDTIWLADGTYSGDRNVNLEYPGDTISLRSVTDNPDACVIDGMHEVVQGIRIHNGETGSSVIRGITIANMDSEEDGGGIFCSNASPTIENCVITGCHITVHKEAVYGAAVYCSQGSPSFYRCRFSGNSTENDGGGLYFDFNSNSILVNCTVDNNTAGSYGGGIVSMNSTVSAVNCTLSGNRCDNGGGALYVYYNSSLLSVNSILWDNSAPTGHEISLANNSTMEAVYSDIQGGTAEAHIDVTSTLTYGTGNIDTDPGFVAAGDYHLSDTSSCIDQGTGDTVTWPDIPNDDIDGDPRPLGSTIDMGSDEVPAATPTASPTITPAVTNTPLETPTPGPIPATTPGGNIILLVGLTIILLVSISKRIG